MSTALPPLPPCAFMVCLSLPDITGMMKLTMGWIENVGEIEMTAKYKYRNPKGKAT